MNQVIDEKLNIYRQYLNMVIGIEEGFEYLIASFTDFSKTEGDLVLSDILQALSTIAHTNILLEQLIIDDEKVQQAIIQYKDVIEASLKLDWNFGNHDTKVKIINESLYPTFSSWSGAIQIALARLVAQ